MEKYLNLTESSLSRTQAAENTSIESFLVSVEKRAYVIAMAACHDRDTALDIVQDSMLSMVKSYMAKPADQWAPLFFRVLNNRITDHHRKRGFSRLTQWFGRNENDLEDTAEAVDQLDSEDFGPDVILESQDMNAVMQGALEALSFKQQQALVLRLWQGLSVKETAVAMGISEGSVKTHLSRAVGLMRTQLEAFRQI